MRITVTGSSGYIGSALSNLLEAMGHEVQRADILQGIDISTETGISTIARWNPALIYNLAGIVGEPESRKNPRKAIDVNAYAPVALRSVCKDAMFIQASTASVLDRNIGIDKTPYAYSKKQAEADLMLLQRRGKCAATIIFRFATVFGWNELGKMRWELPINQMCLDAVQKGRIVLFGPELMRPWIGHGTLVHELIAAMDWARCDYPGPVPLCEFNASLEEVAEGIHDMINFPALGCAVPKLICEPKGIDARDYTMPAMVHGDGMGTAAADMCREAKEVKS